MALITASPTRSPSRVTKIADAYAVHAKVKAEEATAAFAADIDGEDRRNVMNRKIYTDPAARPPQVVELGRPSSLASLGAGPARGHRCR